MKAQCEVTFEFQLKAPLTWKGTIEGIAASTVISRAVRVAKKELRPNNWSSLIVVILERDNNPEDEE